MIGLQQAAPVQQAAASFFVPITVAYLAACGGWLLLARLLPGLRLWPPPEQEAQARSSRPWLDLGVALLAAAAVLALGQAYNAGWLLPSGEGIASYVSFNVNTLLIFSPLFAVMLLRRQGPDSVYLSARALPQKLAAGAALALVGLAVFLGLRGELDRAPAVLAGTVAPRSLEHAIPVFLEGVAVAFLFVRLRWALGAPAALLVPCLLFAAAHVHGDIEQGRPAAGVVAFFALNTLLPCAIFAVVARSRDVVWIGVVHYVLDVAIEAFG